MPDHIINPNEAPPGKIAAPIEWPTKAIRHLACHGCCYYDDGQCRKPHVGPWYSCFGKSRADKCDVIFKDKGLPHAGP